LQHQLIPKYMANWKIEKAVEAAKMKVQLMKSIETQMMTTLPSAILELYEMCRLGQVSYRIFNSLSQTNPLGFEHFG
jgi:ribosome maturation protein Sdo1